MKKYILYIISFMFAPCFVQGQTDYAGPDKMACQGAGVSIGNSSPGNVCYTWDAADGLNPNDIHSTNPTVHPDHPTTYTVHVSGNNFTFSTTDQVKVKVGFSIEIHPSYINLSGPLENQATATLIANEPGGAPAMYEWQIEDAGTTGCDINETSGVIHGCHEAGTVFVRLIDQENPSCYAKKTLEINGGVKDVTAKDNDNEGRVAHKGETLYIVGAQTSGLAGTVNFEAIHNENSSFPAGQPNWSGPLQPPPGNEISWNTQPLSIGTYVETVGAIDPKTVTTQVVGANELSATINVNTGLLNKLKEKLKGGAKMKEEPSAFCDTPLDFSLPGTLSATYKESNVPKYHNKDYATKKEVSIDIPGASVTGCLYFPCCTGGAKFGSFTLFYFTYFGASAGFTLNVAAAKDPSASADPKWILSNNSISISGKLEAGIRLEADVSPFFGFFGGTNLSTEVKYEVRKIDSPAMLQWNANWGGIVGKIAGSVWYGNMDTALEVSFTRSLVPGSETGWQELYDMSAH